MSGHDERETPPSFLPQGHADRGAERGSVPPSFTPSNGQKGHKPQQNSYQPSQVHLTSGQPLPRRQPRRAGGSSRTIRPADSSPSSSQPPSFAARQSRASRAGGYSQPSGYAQPRYANQPGYAQQSFLSNDPQNAGPSYSTGSGFNGVSNGFRGPTAPRGAQLSVPRKHHPGRIIGRILILLIVVALAFVAGLYIWSNSQLAHMKALTTTADDSARTWLILGSDARDGTLNQSKEDVPGERTDTIMLLIRPQSGPSALISIPRDSYVEYNGTGMTINAGGEQEGWTALTQVVENMSGLKVDHVVKIGFAGVKNVVDALGGVQLCYKNTVSDPFSGLNWKAGCHMADGDTALAFSRMRHGDPMGDLGRARRQRLVIQAIAQKVMTPSFIVSGKMPAAVKAGLTSIRVDEHSSPLTLAQMALTFRSTTASGGITGMPVLTSMGTDVYPLGSCVLVDKQQTLNLFSQIKEGTHAPGVVGGLPLE